MELERLDKFYALHSKFYDLTRPFFLLSRKRALSLLKFNKNDKVLDLACGTGLNVRYLLKKVPPENITGIDYSESMLAIAKKKYPKVKFINGDASTFSLGQKFDKIICTYSLSMIEEWEKTIANAKKHLKKNGVFLVLDFNKWQGLIKPLHPLFRKWLLLHGVNPDKDCFFEMKKHFRKVEKHVWNFSYNVVLIASVN
ncbi:class I SAM-dependent methyltransferase [Candidatus Pacearchaeota archaeon]|nr:MAG: class I SAM-dependent methyltransferase [Candidatus Pacearchaeota archaeon]